MNWLSIYGDIVTKHGPYLPGTPDWGRGAPSITISDDGQPCDCTNQKLGNIADAIQNAKFTYIAAIQNSNSAAYTMLNKAGFVLPRDLPVSAPGWGRSLDY